MSWSYAKEVTKPNPKPNNQQTKANPTNRVQKICTTWNSFRKEGICHYEFSNPGESCVYLHHCSKCKAKGLSKRHKEFQCTESENTAPASAAPSSSVTPVTSAQQPPPQSPPSESPGSLSSSSLQPAVKDISSGTFLKPLYFVFQNGFVFHDKHLPGGLIYEENFNFNCHYFTSLHEQVSSYNTHNFNGARISLQHSKINIKKFRELLPTYFSDLAILQYLEFGFPLGLNENYNLKPCSKNHSSSYEFYTHIDSFILKEISFHGLTGPFYSSLFTHFMVLTPMTTPQKPNLQNSI